MADFRKLFLVLAVGALLFTSIASAAPYACVATTVPTIIRGQGGHGGASYADYVGEILLVCEGTPTSTQQSAGITANIRVTLSPTNITSIILDADHTPPVTEAALILDEGVGAGGQNYIGYDSISDTVLESRDDGTQNVYQAVRISDTQVEWQGVVLLAPGSNPFKSIRLTNIRANAQALPASSEIFATVNIVVPAAGVPLDNARLMHVATTEIGMVNFEIDSVDFSSCVAQEVHGRRYPHGEHFHYRITEGFATSFKPVGLAASDNTVPGGGYPNESGFNPGSYSGDLIDGMGQASTGTRLVARLNNVPAGVSLVVENEIETDNGLLLQFVEDPEGPIFRNGSLAGSSGTSTVESSDGVAVIVYEVTEQSTISKYSTDTVEIKVWPEFDWPGIPGSANINMNFGPIDEAFPVMATLEDSPAPRFDDNPFPDELGVLGITGCHTLLLFPYLTNQAGFDTGIVIANTSTDPVNTTPQHGSCTLFWYGFVGDNEAVPDFQTTDVFAQSESPDVPSGAQLILLLSAGAGNVMPMGSDSDPSPVACSNCAPVTFQGYMIADCTFQFAHGYAFISDLGASKLAQGYLALIIPNRDYAGRHEPDVRIPVHAGLDDPEDQMHLGEQLGN